MADIPSPPSAKKSYGETNEFQDRIKEEIKQEDELLFSVITAVISKDELREIQR